jgi:hypothetical protein
VFDLDAANKDFFRKEHLFLNVVLMHHMDHVNIRGPFHGLGEQVRNPHVSCQNRESCRQDL